MGKTSGLTLSHFNRKLLEFASSLALLLLAGCAPKKPVYPVIYIDAACLKEPVQLHGCDGADPPHCKLVKVIYAKGCERVSAK